VKKALLILTATLLLAAPLAQGEGPVDETRFTLRDELLRLINRDRKQFGLAPVQLDTVATSVAEEFCKQQIRDRTAGHFTLDGLAPYMRYSFAGGNDGVSENTAAWSASYSFGDRALYEMLRRSEEEMMSEVAPHDGHRRAILDPYATHVGIGLAWERGEFRIAEEFVRRYVSWARPVPRAATVNDRVQCAGKPAPGYKVEAITVHHEPLPEPMSAIVANKIESYSLPQNRREYLPRLAAPYRRLVGEGVEEVTPQYRDGRRGDFAVTEEGGFAMHVPFSDGPGVYTIVVWVRKPGEAQTIAASNVSVRVEDVARVSYSSR
jgi:uncharacterized protein YkwD